MKERTILVVIPVREEHRELLEEAAPGNRCVFLHQRGEQGAGAGSRYHSGECPCR